MKRGPVPKGKVKIKWSSNFAYAIGLIVTDGNLSPDGRHISFTSKDREMVENYMEALSISSKLGRKSRGFSPDGVKKYFVVQFSDVLFYKFLQSIGLMANKSKIIAMVQIPKKYFTDFLRGLLDGDGSTYSYYDPRWRSSYMFYTTFCSASKEHVIWLQNEINKILKIKGHISSARKSSVFQLKYAKKESLKLLKATYRNSPIYLSRKKLKIDKMLAIIGEKV